MPTTNRILNGKHLSSGLGMTRAKACKIVRDGSVRGHPLTEAQRGMFGAKYGGRVKNEDANPTENAWSAAARAAAIASRKARTLSDVALSSGNKTLAPGTSRAFALRSHQDAYAEHDKARRLFHYAGLEAHEHGQAKVAGRYLKLSAGHGAQAQTHASKAMSLATIQNAEATPMPVELQSGEVKKSVQTSNKDFSSVRRQTLAEQGKALPDGSFPIESTEDLRNAIKAHGRATDPATAKRHIIKRARAIGKSDELPTDWTANDEMGGGASSLGGTSTPSPTREALSPSSSGTTNEEVENCGGKGGKPGPCAGTKVGSGKPASGFHGMIAHHFGHEDTARALFNKAARTISRKHGVSHKAAANYLDSEHGMKVASHVLRGHDIHKAMAIVHGGSGNAGRVIQAKKYSTHNEEDMTTENANPRGINQYTKGKLASQLSEKAREAGSKAQASGKAEDHLAAYEKYSTASVAHEEIGNKLQAKALKERGFAHYKQGTFAQRGGVIGSNATHNEEDMTTENAWSAQARAAALAARRASKKAYLADKHDSDLGKEHDATQFGDLAHSASVMGKHGKAAGYHEEAMAQGGSPLHQKAAELNRKALQIKTQEKGHRLPAENDQSTHNEEGITMPFNRQAAIGYLTTNCDCWKKPGRKEVLNTLDDDALADLQTNALTFNALVENDDEGAHQSAAVSRTGGKTVREVSKLVQVEGDTDEEIEAESDKRGAMKKTVSTNAAIEAWLDTVDAPAPVRRLVENARMVEQREKAVIIKQLVANVHNQDKRRAMMTKFNDLPLPELRDLLELVPRQIPTVNSDDNPFLDYAGLSGGVHSARLTENEQTEVLDLAEARKQYDPAILNKKSG